MKKEQLLENARPHYSKEQLSQLEKAIDFATKAHEGQKRKSGDPYITHCLSVADILIDWGMDIDSVIAGVLHDTVEDTEVALEDIEQQFGKSIAFLVDGVTKVGQARSGMRDIHSYLPQTHDNLSKLLIAVGQDIRVVIIKLADRLHNLQTLKYMPKDKQVKIARESLAVFAPMADRLGMGRIRMQIEEIAFSYTKPKEFKKLKKLLKDRLGKSHRKLAVVRQEVNDLLDAENITHTLDGRIKSIYSLHKKLAKVDDNIDDIYDLIALRIVVDSKEDCYRVLGLLHSMYQPMIQRIKDYVATPKPNGYQSIHTTVLTPNKQIVEFQVRTKAMHEYAERGLAATFHYHAQKEGKDYKKRQASVLPPQLQWITELQEVASKLKSDQTIGFDQLKVDLFDDRIFVYSPKGDIYNLPEGAYPLDFAYQVHSDVAKHAFSFKINGKMAPFNTRLKDGDIIEITTKKRARPKAAWLELVATSHAKSKLKAQLKKEGVMSTIITNATNRLRQKTAQKKRKEEKS
ncbi:bifunctional (p)ppGpp synthetase/guanosine-3',5'-bis(diphosphate) 3'-pyrophosphohydrolase [Candidatus Saccharibacteria bacterium]|nr:bifunctional (p)ppGpp synthetase/guanosine-3',5'-bis(diphosphate) 3'-pyrophosphohydrolase [Candidatus Saccharibacteria bacterium]